MVRHSLNQFFNESILHYSLFPVPCSLSACSRYNRAVITVEIVTIGNEVLLGLVQDTNSNYLCRVVRGMGGRVRRIAIVRDELEEIAAEIKASVDRRADLVFTSGGLGPTD